VVKAIISNSIQEAKALLQNGDVVAIPTETVYGLAANALNATAVAKIFEAKNRPFFDPLIVHVASVEEAEKYVQTIPAPLLRLMQTFSPGPLTVLLKKKDVIPDIVTSGLDTVGIRIPNHPLTLALLAELDFPLCAPSANPFGYVSPTSAQHVFKQLAHRIPYILDGGKCAVGVESTIVGMENNEVVVYRLGGIAIEEIEKIAGKVKLNISQGSNPKAPGMLDVHYAPSTLLHVGDVRSLATQFQVLRLGLISFSDAYSDLPFVQRNVLSPAANLSEAAANLFEALRSFDEKNIDIIIAETFPDEGLGRAINDRLRRASTK
jgi:L-threonylcarbamoyladenylate synthase